LKIRMGIGYGTVQAFRRRSRRSAARPRQPATRGIRERASDRLWATSRDGDVVLLTTADRVSATVNNFTPQVMPAMARHVDSWAAYSEIP
jgi:hypothetical protein